MSASEKLLRLDEGRAARAEAVSAEYADAWFRTTLDSALPALIAVVEAAENAVTCAWVDKATDEQNEELKRRADAIPAALAVLDEALGES